VSQRAPVLKILEAISVLLFIVFVWMVFFYAPLEASMGAVQRVFYFHVATAWVGMLGFVAAGVAGIAYLRTHDFKWDIIEVAAVEISLVFFLIAIVLGSIWAYPAWNTWWTWEPRLTTAAVLELIYLAYLLLRQGIEEPEKRARFGAIYTIVGGLSVPITFMSIRLFRTIHPVVVGSANAMAKGGFDMTPKMLQTMFFSIIVFSFVFIVLFWHRIRLGQLAQKVEELKLKFND
jgi:heme exporter protein C